MNIMVISGSAAKQSNTRRLADYVRVQLQAAKVNVLYYDVGVDALPIYDGESTSSSAVSTLLHMVRQADGFYICTPEYHNGISGALKNALDYLDASYFKDKPTAISAAAGGGKGGINALNNLRLVLRGLYALVLPEQCVCDPDDLLDAAVASEPSSRIRKLTEQLTHMVAALKRVEPTALYTHG